MREQAKIIVPKRKRIWPIIITVLLFIARLAGMRAAGAFLAGLKAIHLMLSLTRNRNGDDDDKKHMHETDGK